MKQYPNTPSHCPYCDSPNICGWEWDAEYQEAWQVIQCDACGKRWHDVYKLVGYEDLT